MLRRWIHPIGFNRIPKLLQTLFVRVPVLDNEGFDPFGMFQRDAVSHGRAVIHDVHRIVISTQIGKKTVHEICKMGEGISERSVIWGSALAKSGMVRRDDVVALGKSWNQVPEHVG